MAFLSALQGARDLTRVQYEALHDGVAEKAILSPKTNLRFSVGDKYESSFQDLAVEYYGFVSG